MLVPKMTNKILLSNFNPKTLQHKPYTRNAFFQMPRQAGADKSLAAPVLLFDSTHRRDIHPIGILLGWGSLLESVLSRLFVAGPPTWKNPICLLCSPIRFCAPELPFSSPFGEQKKGKASRRGIGAGELCEMSKRPLPNMPKLYRSFNSSQRSMSLKGLLARDLVP